MNRIPLFEKTSYDKKTLHVIEELFDSGIVSTSSNFVKDMERVLSDYYSRYVLLTNSGTSAIHLSSLILKEGSVLLPEFGFISVANAFKYDNRDIILYSLDKNLQPDWESVRKIVREENVSIFVVVHQFGIPVIIDEDIKNLFYNREITIVEDGSEAILSKTYDKEVGTIGDISILSFNGNKVVSAGGGGAFITSSKEIYDKARKLSVPSEAKKGDIYTNITYNYRMNGLNAALLKDAWEKKDTILEKRKKILSYYKSFPFDTPNVEGDINYWLYPVYLKSLDLKIKLKDFYVEHMNFFKPFYEMSYLSVNKKYLSGTDLFSRGVLFPVNSRLCMSDVEKIYNMLK